MYIVWIYISQSLACSENWGMRPPVLLYSCLYIYIYVCIYVYIYISLSLSLPLSRHKSIFYGHVHGQTWIRDAFPPCAVQVLHCCIVSSMVLSQPCSCFARCAAWLTWFHFQWIGLRENLNRKPEVFPSNKGFPVNFSLNQSIDTSNIGGQEVWKRCSLKSRTSSIMWVKQCHKMS